MPLRPDPFRLALLALLLAACAVVLSCQGPSGWTLGYDQPLGDQDWTRDDRIGWEDPPSVYAEVHWVTPWHPSHETNALLRRQANPTLVRVDETPPPPPDATYSHGPPPQPSERFWEVVQDWPWYAWLLVAFLLGPILVLCYSRYRSRDGG